MSTSRYFDRICACVLVFTLILTVLFMNGQSFGIELVVDADSEAHSDSEYFTENDQLSDWDISSATYITLEGDTVSINGKNAYEYDGSVVISGSGKYVISGTLDDGYITVNANANSKVWILLNGVDISCSDNACLRVDEADKVFLTLAEGTTNTLTGSEELSEEALEDGTYGVIFAHDDLTINGSGSLQINAGYKHGIKANDDLVITGGTITIDAPADGIHVNDSFRLKEAVLSIKAGDDGILTENEESFFYLESGAVTINAEGDGIHSGGSVIIAGGTITMDAGDDGIHADGDIEIDDGVIEMNSCYEGIEGATITVSGGDITIYPADDGFNASSGSTSEAGMFGNWGEDHGNMAEIEPGMQPPEMSVPLDETVDNTLNDAAEDKSEDSSEGSQPDAMPDLEENMMKPPAMSEEDGIPAQMWEGGNEYNEFQETQQDVENYIQISGGTITIINENGNDADGLDSNGDVFITGGDIRISLTDNGTNSAIDAATENGGIVEISGGTVIACGSSSMAEAFDSTSSQCSIMYNVSSGMEEGTSLAVEDADGTVILSWEVPCSFSSAVLSSPDMQIGGTYTVIVGDSEETVTLSEVSAAYGDAQSTIFTGNMDRGGGTHGSEGEAAPRMTGGGMPEAVPNEMNGSDSSANIVSESSSEIMQGPGPGHENENPGTMQGGEGRAEMDRNTADTLSDVSEDGTNKVSAASYSTDVWILTILSFLVLGAGLFIAKKYRRY